MISSYLVANEETARRGILLSFVSAMMQALVAVLIVGIGAWMLNATAKTMCGAERVIEIASYALIAAFGARLVWSKGGSFMRALQAAPAPRRLRWRRPALSTSMVTAMRMTTIMVTAPVRTTTTTGPMNTTRIAATPTGRNRRNSQAPAAGGAALAR